MATRLHVTAVRHDDVAEVQRVFTDILGPRFSDVPIHGNAGWLSFCTSVWFVGRNDLFKGVCTLARPALIFTTEDDCRWYGTVIGAPERPTFIHEHGTFRRAPTAETFAGSRWTEPDDEATDPDLAFLEDPPPPGGPRNTPLDRFLADQGAGGMIVPDELRSRLLELPLHEAAAELRLWSADQFCAALTAANIPHDHQAVRAAYLWEGLTQAELESNLGNLPRLLSVLGLGGDWDAWIKHAEAPPPAEAPPSCTVESAPERVPPAIIGPILQLLRDTALSPLEGPPVEVPLAHVARSAFLADLASFDEVDVGVVLTFTWPEDLKTKKPPTKKSDAREVEEIELQVQPGMLQVGCDRAELALDMSLKQLITSRWAQWLKSQPEGVRLEVALAAPEPKATHQRFAGPIKDQTWYIQEVYPPLAHAVVAEALHWAGQLGKQRFTAASAAEADAIMAAVRLDSYLHNMGVEQRGRTIACEFDSGHLARLFARHRLKDRFDFSAGDARRREQLENWRRQRREMMKAAVAQARARSAPHDPEVFHRGAHTLFWKSDLTRFEKLDPEPRLKFDQALAELGFSPLGDIVAKKYRDFILRVGVSPDLCSYAILTAKFQMYLSWEFFTRFDNGMTLTTTTNAAVGSRPEDAVFYKVCPGLDVPALYAKHQWGLGRFLDQHGTRPVPLEPSLLGVVKEFDDAIGRAPEE